MKEEPKVKIEINTTKLLYNDLLKILWEAVGKGIQIKEGKEALYAATITVLRELYNELMKRGYGQLDTCLELEEMTGYKAKSIYKMITSRKDIILKYRNNYYHNPGIKMIRDEYPDKKHKKKK